MAKKVKRTVRTRRGTREYTVRGCPLMKNRSTWCFRICVPNADGTGECGRLAPHGIKSRTQRAIEEHRRKLRDEYLAELESAYLAAAENEGYELGVRVTGGEAEVVLPMEGRSEAARDAGPTDSLCFKTMNDSARLAICSLVDRGTPVSTVDFAVQLTNRAPAGELIARSLFVGMSGARYGTESVLTDANGREIGRANGTFAEGPSFAA